MESGQLSPEAHQPHATRTDLDTHARSCPDQAMQEGEAGPTRTARDHLGPGLAPILPQAPGLQGGPGDRQSLGGVTLGYPLGVSSALPGKPCGASAPLPSGLALGIATLGVVDYSAHSSLLSRSPGPVSSGKLRMRRSLPDGHSSLSRVRRFLGCHGDEMADVMIEAATSSS